MLSLPVSNGVYTCLQPISITSELIIQMHPSGNKSPIESVLHQSSMELLGELMDPPGNSHLYKQRVGDPHAQTAQFRVSYNEGAPDTQGQLRAVQLLCMGRLEIALETLAAVLGSKARHRVNLAMRLLKRGHNNSNPVVNVGKGDKGLIIKRAGLLQNKLYSILDCIRLKTIGNAFTIIAMAVCDDGEREASNSRLQHSDRGESEWQLAHSHGCLDSHENLARENRQLRRKKDKVKAKREDFYHKIGDLLSFHEAFVMPK